MKVLILGSSGTIGSAVVKELSRDTELVTANRTSGDYRVDLSEEQSIRQLFALTGPLDGIVCAGSRGVTFKPLQEMTIQDYQESLVSKLLGQIQVVLQGLHVLQPHGSMTLTTGMMNRDFVRGGTAASLVNSAVEGFARAAALDLPNGIRLNVVSPNVLEASVEKYAALCPGFEPVSAEKVARAYRKSIYGIQTGMVFQVV